MLRGSHNCHEENKTVHNERKYIEGGYDRSADLSSACEEVTLDVVPIDKKDGAMIIYKERQSRQREHQM